MDNRIIPAFLMAAALTTSCGSDKKQAAAETAEQAELVEISLVTEQDVPRSNDYTANVEAFNTNNISPASPNRIKTIRVDVGDRVSRGQVVATMDNAQATQLKVNLDQIERDYNRAVKLLAIGSGTQMTVDQLKAQLDAARTQYNNVLENTVLTSPVSGVVTARNYDPGDMTGTQPILSVGQISPNVKVVINVTESDRANTVAGLPVQVRFDAYPDRVFDARISRVYPAVDPATRTFQAEVQVPNAKTEIFPGMFARVSVDHGTVRNTVVPDRAVVKQTGSGNKFVYIYKNGTVKFVPVQLGRRMDDAYEITEGVTAGDTVVTAGQTRLADGVKVRIKK